MLLIIEAECWIHHSSLYYSLLKNKTKTVVSAIKERNMMLYEPIIKAISESEKIFICEMTLELRSEE